MQIGSPVGTGVQSQSGPKPLFGFEVGNQKKLKATRQSKATTNRMPTTSPRLGYGRGHLMTVSQFSFGRGRRTGKPEVNSPTSEDFLPKCRSGAALCPLIPRDLGRYDNRFQANELSRRLIAYLKSAH